MAPTIQLTLEDRAAGWDHLLLRRYWNRKRDLRDLRDRELEGLREEVRLYRRLLSSPVAASTWITLGEVLQRRS